MIRSLEAQVSEVTGVDELMSCPVAIHCSGWYDARSAIAVSNAMATYLPFGEKAAALGDCGAIAVGVPSRELTNRPGNAQARSRRHPFRCGRGARRRLVAAAVAWETAARGRLRARRRCSPPPIHREVSSEPPVPFIPGHGNAATASRGLRVGARLGRKGDVDRAAADAPDAERILALAMVTEYGVFADR